MGRPCTKPKETRSQIRDRVKRAAKERYDLRKSLGLCIRCAGLALPGQTRCEACNAANRALVTPPKPDEPEEVAGPPPAQPHETLNFLMGLPKWYEPNGNTQIIGSHPKGRTVWSTSSRVEASRIWRRMNEAIDARVLTEIWLAQKINGAQKAIFRCR